jgi:hypothetical protein
MIPLDDIIVPKDRMRQLRPEKVDEFAESIAAQGQLQPIIVRPYRGKYLLVVGWHRLEAKRKLERKTIEGRVVEGLDTDQALLTEIDENLVRSDLSEAEIASHLVRRKEIYLRRHPETKQGVAGGKASGRKRSNKSQNESCSDGFVNVTAKATGKGRSTIARKTARREKIDPQALADLAGTCLDNGTELDALPACSRKNCNCSTRWCPMLPRSAFSRTQPFWLPHPASQTCRRQHARWVYISSL